MFPPLQPDPPTPAVIESGPRSPQTTEPPWLRMIVTETKVRMCVTEAGLYLLTCDEQGRGSGPRTFENRGAPIPEKFGYFSNFFMKRLKFFQHFQNEVAKMYV